MTWTQYLHTKYSTRNIKGGCTGNKFLELNVYLNEIRPSVKIQLLNIFKDHHIVAWSGPTSISYDK